MAKIASTEPSFSGDFAFSVEMGVEMGEAKGPRHGEVGFKNHKEPIWRKMADQFAEPRLLDFVQDMADVNQVKDGFFR